MKKRDFEAAIGAALDEAGAVLTTANAIDAERLGKAASALIRASRDLAEFASKAAENSSEENEKALRAEQRRRIARFVNADLSRAPSQVLERIATTGSAE